MSTKKEWMQSPYLLLPSDLDLLRHHLPLDTHPQARSMSHDDRKKEDTGKEKDRKTTDILANTIGPWHTILPTFQCPSWFLTHVACPADIRPQSRKDSCANRDVNRCFEEINEEGNETIHPTLLLPSPSEFVPFVARPFDVCPRESIDIKCADRREDEVGKREWKRESTTTEVDDPSNPSPSCVDSSDWCPSSPAHLTFAHSILWILAVLM